MIKNLFLATSGSHGNRLVNLMRAVFLLVFCAFIFIPQFVHASGGDICSGDMSDSKAAKQWSKDRGFPIAKDDSKCAPTTVATADINLGANSDPQTGKPRTPEDLQTALTKCLSDNGFLDRQGACSIVDASRNARLICDCNEKVTGKKFTCKGLEYSPAFWTDVQSGIDDGCAAICMGMFTDGTGHVFQVTDSDAASITMIEPNGGTYTLGKHGDSDQVGNPDEPYFKRIAEGGSPGLKLHMTSCVMKCTAPMYVKFEERQISQVNMEQANW